MTYQDSLQARFERALRKELGLGGYQAGTPSVHVDVQPAAVTVTPVIRASLPMPDTPIEVFDVSRANGAYSFRMAVKRDAATGLIADVSIVPERFFPLGAFQNE